MSAERSLTVDELLDLTTRLIGHCNDLGQLEHIIIYAQARLEFIKSPPSKRKIGKKL